MITLFMAVAMMLLTMNSTKAQNKKDKDGHALVKEWEAYKAACDKDRPKEQETILVDIKAKALAAGELWDWYCAGEKLADVRASINWKERSVQWEKWIEEIRGCDFPVVKIYSGMAGDVAGFVIENETKLRGSHNPEFYSHDSRIANSYVYSKALLPLLKNDYEYALWAFKLYDRLESYYGEAYPFAAFIEYSRGADREEFAKKYEGKAVALLGRQDILEKERKAIKKSDEEGFKALYEKCLRFMDDQSKFNGGEKAIAVCCTKPEGIAKGLCEPFIESKVEKGKASVILHNLKSAKFELLEGKKTVFQKRLENPKNSFYVGDTVSFKLPEINDGSYDIKISEGKAESSNYYNRYTLSIAARTDAEGTAVYVADYKSGKPIGRCKIELLENSKVVSSAEMNITEGFVRLPSAMQNKLKGGKYYYNLRASVTGANGIIRKSHDEYVYGSGASDPKPVNTQEARCEIITDRAAFNPGETVHFKAVLYRGTYSYEAFGAGENVKVRLMDAENKKVAEQKLKTNEFGSIAGEFELVKGNRGGSYRIIVEYGGKDLAWRYITVDEFVLPSFTMAWDEPEHIYLAGDRITVSGKVLSYSGHSVGGAKAEYEVRGYRDIINGELELKDDGSFEFAFPTPDDRAVWYSIQMKVTDSTGETLEFGTSRRTEDRLSISLSLEDPANGSVEFISTNRGELLKGDLARVRYTIDKYEGLLMNYTLRRDGKALAEGKENGSGVLEFDLGAYGSGLFELEAKAEATSENGKKYNVSQTLGMIRVADDDAALDVPVRAFFKELEYDKGIALMIGSTNGPVWAVAEAFVNGNRLLSAKMVYLDGKLGKDGSLKTVRFDAPSGDPRSMRVEVLFFRDERSFRYSCSRSFLDGKELLPLEFSSFRDMTLPGSEYEFTIASAKAVEIAATIFDVSTETLHYNGWPTITPARVSEPMPNYFVDAGKLEGGGFDEYFFYGGAVSENVVIGYGTGPKNVQIRGLKTKAANANMMTMDMAVQEEAVQTAESARGESGPAPDVREDFATTIAWEPFLRTDADGNATLKFKTSDKLSTFVVQLFAHDRTLRNRTIRREMKVTIPVKVNIVQPQLLYEGDRYVARVSLASTADAPTDGKVEVVFYDGPEYKAGKAIGGGTMELSVPAGGTAAYECEIEVPAGLEKLGVYASFSGNGAGEASDAMFVAIPVRPAVQTITEAHSALLKVGADRAALEAALRGMFVNIPGSEAALREISIRGMLVDALPERVEPRSDNVIDLVDAYYADMLVKRLGMPGCSAEKNAETMEKIRACRNLDGGFAWFKEMYSSPSVTAAVLERHLKSGGFLTDEEVRAAVTFLDKSYFSVKTHWCWCGMLSMAQYLYIRSMFPGISFSTSGIEADVLKEFRKDAKDYLVPAKERGLNGRVFEKTRRLLTLRNLVSSSDGLGLASKWGISIATGNRISKSLKADIESLLQYAVEHKCGGWYYPNLVMPYRGLLESELGGHAMMCELLDDGIDAKIAEGIRLWMMVQKETQQWESDPAYIEALGCVLSGSEETLGTKVLSLSGTFTKPFADVLASGNGFTVERKYFIGDREIGDGTAVSVGDLVRAEYRIWNEENRSFVKLTAPRPACMRPVQQLSGRIGWWLRPLNVGGSYQFSPQGYRSVLAEATEYWFDSYPEEKTTISEEFYVTQEGSFTSPAVTIESLYAPHYRANDRGRGEVTAL